MKKIKSFILVSLLIFCSNAVLLAQQTGSLSGQVYDSLGAVIIGATVTLVDSTGKQTVATTNKQGEYSFTKLAPGKYTVKANAPKFTVYENTEVEIKANEKNDLTIALDVAAVETNVEVGAPNEVSVDPNDNVSQKITGDQLKDLPDDPDELAAYLQAMAGGAAGPDGANITVDGFAGRLPPKEAIREIRFSQNPFSAEFDRIGFSRVEILTRPGFERWRGGANFNFNDESLNSRNPFALNRAPTQERRFGGNFGGPIKAKKASFWADFNYSQNDNSSVIKAVMLDSSNNIINFNEDVTQPSRRLSFGPRIDFAINENNTLQSRYEFSRNTSDNQGIGGFTLPTRASSSVNTSHEIRLTESMIINPKTVNETRFQFESNDNQRAGETIATAINVNNSFNGGGAQVGNNTYSKNKRWELQNYVTTSLGKNMEHPVKFGVRIRGINIEDRNESGYLGAFTFSGVRDPVTGAILFSSIEQYRQKVLGNANPIFNPNQFSLTSGNPLAKVSQVDYGLFLMDDWRAAKGLTLSFGIRYENQTNISDSFNFSPRFGVAWSPGAGGARQPKTVIRGGFGVFYDRFSENYTLNSIRNDGVSQLRYVVTNSPAILGQAVFTNNSVTNVPTAAQLGAFAPLASVPYRISDSLQTPYSVQTAISVERQLPFRSNISFTYTQSRSLHTLRMRNINAPVCPANITCPTLAADIQLLRPNPTQGNIYQYESSGYSNAKILSVNFRTNFSNRVMFFGGYSYSNVKGDTDSFSSPRGGGGFAGFPAYSYDLNGEYAPSALTAPHSLFTGGSITLPWGFRLNPNIIISSERRFNITTGVDSNRDSIFSERPTFAALAARCQELGLTNSFCDTSGVSNLNAIIPRNYGFAPGSFNVNMGLSKTFGFGGSRERNAQNRQGNQNTNQPAGNQQGGNQGGGGNRGGGRGGGGPQMVMMGGGGGGMMMGGFGGGADRPYNLTFSINARNLFNNVNVSTPQGALTSPFFGKSTNTGGGGFGFFGGGFGGGSSANRRIDVSVRFNF